MNKMTATTIRYISHACHDFISSGRGETQVKQFADTHLQTRKQFDRETGSSSAVETAHKHTYKL